MSGSLVLGSEEACLISSVFAIRIIWSAKDDISSEGEIAAPMTSSGDGTDLGSEPSSDWTSNVNSDLSRSSTGRCKRSPHTDREDREQLRPRAERLEMRNGPDGISPMTAMARYGGAVPTVIGADMVPMALILSVENDLSTSKASRHQQGVGAERTANDGAKSTSTSRTRC
ncbi:UNVERIFIED_CONTAM: hypothetical protein K2H54_039218 [Gekko kuhli]